MCIVMEYADGGDLSGQVSSRTQVLLNSHDNTRQVENAKKAGRYISEEAVLNWYQLSVGVARTERGVGQVRSDLHGAEALSRQENTSPGPEVPKHFPH